jgi:hypothetical protein
MVLEREGVLITEDPHYSRVVISEAAHVLARSDTRALLLNAALGSLTPIERLA